MKAVDISRYILKSTFGHSPVIVATEPSQRYFLDGFLQKTFKKSDAHQSLIHILSQISKHQLKSGFSLEEKAENYFIMRPQAAEYDRVFEDILFENEIPSLLESISGATIYLGTIMVLKHLPGIKANTEWHRDTHFLQGRLSGPLPPAIKMYVYPRFDEPVSQRINFISGSHRLDSQDEIFNRYLISKKKKATFSSSDDDFVIFNTTTLHQAVPDVTPVGSTRLLYTFYTQEKLLDRHPADQALHVRFNQRMKERRALADVP